MGLDQYLTKKTFIGANYEHREITGTIYLNKGNKPIEINLRRVSSIEETVGQWRKANQIHKWFVDNIQEGNDDCKEYRVSIKQLQQLLNDCLQVKEKPVLAETVLPTKSGFFSAALNTTTYT